MPSDFDARIPFREQRIAIFASGAGTNAENVIRYFRSHASIYVALIITNKATAGVVDVAARYGINCEVHRIRGQEDALLVLDVLRRYRIDMVLLAGYLALVPGSSFQRFHIASSTCIPRCCPILAGRECMGGTCTKLCMQQVCKKQELPFMRWMRCMIMALLFFRRAHRSLLRIHRRPLKKKCVNWNTGIYPVWWKTCC